METISQEVTGKNGERREILQIVENGVLGPTHSIIPMFKTTKQFITNDEYNLYKCLEEICQNSGIRIFAQVALNRIIDTNSQRYYTDKKKDCVTNKMKGYSIDFVLYDIEKRDLICCIELNGPSHQTDPDTIKKDEFLRETFPFLRIPLIEIPSAPEYKTDEIKARIRKGLNEHLGTI